MNRIRFLCVLIVLIYYCNGASLPKNNDECNLPQEVIDDISGYAQVANLIMDYYTEGEFKGQTWKRISDFVDKFGHRISGSQSLEDSIDYMISESNANNLENIHTENVTVPKWTRGEESVTLLSPRLRNLPMLGLGLSIGTPPEGITAQGLVVKSFDDLHELSNEEVEGKIVIYDPPFTTYGEMAQYRGYGAAEAAKKGAVAALIRSVADFSISSPHTGVQEYEEGVEHIPIAAISLEDADYLRREQDRGNEIVIKLVMSATLENSISRNFITDYKGSELEDKIVVVSGHIDSWDVGDGSMDDAGGCFISWLAAIALKDLGLRPRRTLRTILFTAEEQGIIGALAYEENNKELVSNLSFVMEADFETFAPLGLMYEGGFEGECMLKEILKLFTSINASNLVLEEAGPDVSIWTYQGIPGAGLLNANDRYFWFHHSDGDTLNVLKPEELDKNGGFWAAVSYIIADMKYEIPRGEINRGNLEKLKKERKHC